MDIHMLKRLSLSVSLTGAVWNMRTWWEKSEAIFEFLAPKNRKKFLSHILCTDFLRVKISIFNKLQNSKTYRTRFTWIFICLKGYLSVFHLQEQSYHGKRRVFEEVFRIITPLVWPDGLTNGPDRRKLLIFCKNFFQFLKM